MQQIGAERPQTILFFLTLRFWHHNAGTVTLGGGHKGKANAGVARGSLHHPAAGLDQPLCFGILDNEQGGAVFNRAAGVGKLAFCQNVAARALRGPTQAHEGRISDQMKNILKSSHGNMHSQQKAPGKCGNLTGFMPPAFA
jgi:hypothetical protein